MQTALAERHALIETAARNLVREAQEAGAAWVARLGRLPAQPRQREQWLAHAATVALYRHRYDIIGPTPLGDPKSIKIAEQAAEYRVVQVALRSAQAIGAPADGTAPRRDTRRLDQGRRL